MEKGYTKKIHVNGGQSSPNIFLIESICNDIFNLSESNKKSKTMFGF